MNLAPEKRMVRFIPTMSLVPGIEWDWPANASAKTGCGESSMDVNIIGSTKPCPVSKAIALFAVAFAGQSHSIPGTSDI
ncbi:MAG: hypothetical protein AAFN70_19620, partial [Planctomycetota bacterium]